MKIIYEEDLLTRIFRIHEHTPIDCVVLNSYDYDEIFEAVDKADKIAGGDTSWFHIEDCTITFRLEQRT